VPSRARRDLVGRYAGAMRDEGLRVGLYYSGGLDWHFLGPFSARAQPHMGANWFGGATGIPPGREYARYADAHWRELVARYDPDVLWNDIGYPSEGDIAGIAADFYNDNADGVINDRFRQGGLGTPVVQDFGTPEYAMHKHTTPHKWEGCRGIGFSFGCNGSAAPPSAQLLRAPRAWARLSAGVFVRRYNQQEGLLDYLSEHDLITSFTDIVRPAPRPAFPCASRWSCAVYLHDVD